MKKLSIKKEIMLDSISQKASAIFNKNNWAGLWTVEEFRVFITNVRKAASKPNAEYNCWEMYLNLTR